MSGNFTSNAANFSDAMQTGVDPRTGQFFINFALLSAQAHQLLGPAVDLGLNFSSLSQADDFGLGKGVSLGGVSWFDQKSHQLRLSSGESWSVTGAGQMASRRLKDCVFKHNGTSSKTVYWKSGLTEELGKVSADHYLTKRMTAPSGKRVEFEWAWNGKAALLRSLKDENGVIICQWDYKGVTQLNQLIPGTTVTVTVWPGTAERHQIGLGFQNGNLTSLVRQSHADGSDKIMWLMKYGAVAGRSLPTQLDHPTGMVDVITYDSAALKFPVGGVSVPMPGVNRHTRRYGRGQLETVRTYTYTKDRNFLGFGASSTMFGQWQEGKDYLYRMLTQAYEYGSTETVHLGAQKRTTTRTYNNYHFLISEQEQQGQCVVLRQTQYQAKYNTDIEKQPFNYTLPKTQTVTYKRGGQSRAEVTESVFDDYGNPLSMRHADGTVETYEWYPAAGEGLACPAEPNGFVRFLKQERTRCAQVNGYAVPAQVVSYTYEVLGQSACVVQKTSTEYTEQAGKRRCLSHKQTDYETSAGSQFGRVLEIRHTQYDLADAQTGYTTTQRFTTQADEHHTVLTQTVESETHDGLVTRHTRELSALSGRSQRDIDAQGVVTTYEYDGLGRIVSQTHAAGTDYSKTQRWQYAIEDGYPVTVQKDALGNQQRTLFDGAGRAVRSDVYDSDLSRAWYPMSMVYHDALGRTVKQVSFDWSEQDRQAGAGTPSIHVQSESVYDDWGNLARQSGAGTTEVIEYDPIGCVKTGYRHLTSDATRVESKMVTRLDPVSQRPIEVTVLDPEGETLGHVQSVWDGLGRLRKRTDIDGHASVWDYDVYGRVTQQTLPDGSVVEQRYAPDQLGEAATQIGMRANADADLTVIGTRRYDGQGRLSENVCGARRSTYHYGSAASGSPDQVSLPSGVTLGYQYIAEMGDALSQLTATDAKNEEVVVKQFAYDPRSYLAVSQLEGSSAGRFEYTVSGALKTERQIYEGREHVAGYTYTLGGLAQTYTGVDQAKASYSRDASGRVTLIEEPGLTAALTYDAWGRLSQRKVSAQDGRELTTRLAYDALGREISRRIEDGAQHSVLIKQSWSNSGLLTSRQTLQNDEPVKYEAYQYDSRRRLVEYTVSGQSAPKQHGNTVAGQSYVYDACNNLTGVITTHTDDTFDTASYHYDNPADVNQLSSIDYTHQTYPSAVRLEYDAQGRMIKDEAGRALTYDVLGRLAQVQCESEESASSRYAYDATDRLIAQTVGQGEATQLFYRGEELVHEIDGSRHRAYVKAGHASLAMREDGHITLFGVDQNDSVVYTQTATGNMLQPWLPYGGGSVDGQAIGFNGERVDPVSGAYHLGNGYRAYNPMLMRFTCPDSMSPFGAGGINPYAYCAGDPINLTDPSGHLSGQAIAGLVLGGVGLALAIWTMGSSMAAAGGIAAAMNASTATALVMGTTGCVADVIGIASATLEESNPQASATPGWVSMGLGGLAFLGAGGAKLAQKWSNRTSAVLKRSVEGSSQITVPRIAPDESYAYLISEKKLNKVSGWGEANFTERSKMNCFGSKTVQATNSQEGAAFIHRRMSHWLGKEMPNMTVMDSVYLDVIRGHRNNFRLYELNYSGLESINLGELGNASLRDTLSSWGIQRGNLIHDLMVDAGLILIKGPIPAERIRQIGTVDWQGNIRSFINTTSF